MHGRATADVGSMVFDPSSDLTDVEASTYIGVFDDDDDDNDDDDVINCTHVGVDRPNGYGDHGSVKVLFSCLDWKAT